nr:hypothetical protein [Jiangella anatolica]
MAVSATRAETGATSIGTGGARIATDAWPGRRQVEAGRVDARDVRANRRQIATGVDGPCHGVGRALRRTTGRTRTPSRHTVTATRDTVTAPGSARTSSRRALTVGRSTLAAPCLTPAGSLRIAGDHLAAGQHLTVGGAGRLTSCLLRLLALELDGVAALAGVLQPEQAEADAGQAGPDPPAAALRLQRVHPQRQQNERDRPQNGDDSDRANTVDVERLNLVGLGRLDLGLPWGPPPTLRHTAQASPATSVPASRSTCA